MRKDRPPTQRTRRRVMKMWPGHPYPLGAMYDGSGTNFSVHCEHGTRVEVCFFDDDGKELRLDLPEVTAFCWHGYVPDINPGQRYGAPKEGLRCTPSKLLLDPDARAIDGDVTDGPFVPKSVVSQTYFDPPKHPGHEAVSFLMPPRQGSFVLVIDTARATPPKDDETGYATLRAGEHRDAGARSVQVYRHVA